ncbi:MAG: nuclear transport factor 2 family protein [Proteobacteria bacterium]|jgi:hypothetical protein|nr:nuclear transport factor 2 family protein [Pseudomonadota bacterium]
MAEADDYFAILNLIHLYAEHLDRGDFAAVGGLFADADVYMPGDVEPSVRAGTGDFAGLLSRWTRLYPETGTPRTRHVTTNPIVGFDGPDAAWVRSSFTVLQQTPALALQPIIVGSYHDRFARVGGVWRFAERREFVTLVGDLSAHLLQPFSPPNS